jgi:SIR2-like domain
VSSLAPDENHYWLVAGLIADGEVIPFLGAGANLCDRPADTPWELGRYLPNGAELAHALAERSRYPLPDDADLLRVSQYVDAVLGEKQLYRYLRAVLDADYPPTSLHRLLAGLPPLLRERGSPQQLILTTNYDDALETAFADRGEEYDLVWYEAKKGSHLGKFIHRPPGGEATSIDRPNEYADLSLADRTVIMKLHGAFDRGDAKLDSYVITEDHYIDYLSTGDIAVQIPITLRERMADSHFLFLGYSMRDWNLRVILNRIWGSQQLDLKSWAVQREPGSPGLSKIEQVLWQDRGDVDLVYASLKEYVAGLAAQLPAAVEA